MIENINEINHDIVAKVRFKENLSTKILPIQSKGNRFIILE
jgi:hypothetical protein